MRRSNLISVDRHQVCDAIRLTKTTLRPVGYSSIPRLRGSFAELLSLP